jgi:hypothetical protein
MAQLMQNSGKTGWLYRVVAGGQVSSDAPLELVSRLSDVSVHEAGAIAWHMPFDDEQYHRLLSAAGLSVSWSRTMQKRRLSGRSRIIRGDCGENNSPMVEVMAARAPAGLPGLARAEAGTASGALIQRQPEG